MPAGHAPPDSGWQEDSEFKLSPVEEALMKAQDEERDAERAAEAAEANVKMAREKAKAAVQWPDFFPSCRFCLHIAPPSPVLSKHFPSPHQYFMPCPPCLCQWKDSIY